jgi:hypothetical protein
MAVRLCSEYEDSFLHAVCGKILHPETIGLEYQRRAPAFVLSATYSHRLATQALGIRTRSYVPRNDADGVIASRDMLIPVAEQIDLPSLKHAQAIVYALVRYLPIT